MQRGRFTAFVYPCTAEPLSSHNERLGSQSTSGYKWTGGAARADTVHRQGTGRTSSNSFATKGFDQQQATVDASACR